ncbi:MAG: hypothetical protein U1G08_22215 [Verrucomicrobiota bacterium]
MSTTASPQPHHRRSWIPAALWIRIAFLVPFLIAGAVVWLGIARMRPALRESAALSHHLATVLERLEAGDRDTRDAAFEDLESRIQRLRETWVRDLSEIERWIAEASQTATLQGWKLRHEPGPIESQDAEGLPVTRATVLLNLQPTAGTGGKTLHQLLQFSEAIADTRLRPDLEELNVAAADPGIIEARMAIRFWTLCDSP